MGCHVYQHHDRWSASPAKPALTHEERERLADAALDLRVSHAEREDVAAELAHHYAAGRLTVEEYEERVTAALAARTGRDFEPLLADLPEDRATAGAEPAPAAPAWPRVSRRALVVAAIVVLAILTEGWVLWLLLPAWCMAGKHRLDAYRSYGYAGPHGRRPGHHRPATQWT